MDPKIGSADAPIPPPPKILIDGGLHTVGIPPKQLLNPLPIKSGSLIPGFKKSRGPMILSSGDNGFSVTVSTIDLALFARSKIAFISNDED